MTPNSRGDTLQVTVQWFLACDGLNEIVALLPELSRQIFSAVTIPENVVSCCQRPARQSSPQPNKR